MNKSNCLVCIVFLLSVFSGAANATDVNIQFDPDLGQHVFAVQHLTQACAGQSIECLLNKEAEFNIVLTCRALAPQRIKLPETLGEEAFAIRRTGRGEKTTLYVIGGGHAGTLYGALELAELITIKGIKHINDVDQTPYMNMRGIKFNIPLDVRTPSYTDVSDAAQENMGDMWSLAFWKECIDNLAKHRYNFVSLWSLHPFPSMVRVPEYENVALDDVHRSTVEWKEYYNGNGVGFDAREIIDNIEVIKEITMDEKMAFWRKVMAYGKSRNVDFYVVTWNIFVNGTDGKYGITDKVDNPTTTDYFRKSVKQMFVAYPDLAGIGLTTGENMPGVSTAAKEQWAFDTFGQGILDAAQALPGRKMKLLHRQHQTGAQKIAEQFKPLVDHPDIDFLFSFKYAKAHVYSCTEQPFHQAYVKDIAGMKTIWTLRNDDTYYFRWGAPDFVREFIQNIPLDVSEGWYLGSDQWIWGREFLSNEPTAPRELELSKHWYQWLLWGRLGYDPKITNDRFEQILQAAYPAVNAAKLRMAWQEASMVYPKTTGFHWGMFDFQWYIEGCKGRPGYAQTETGFHDVNRFINLPPLESTDYLSIPEYVELKQKGQNSDRLTPLQLAGQIHGHADKALALLEDLDSKGHDELRKTLNDIRIISAMGKYYAFKIEGATHLEYFRQTKQKQYQQKAIERLNRAAEQWRLYASLALTSYKNPLWTNRVGHVNWRELMDDAMNDVKTAGGKPELNSMPLTVGGTVIRAKTKGNSVNATFNARQAGTYCIEVEYAYAQGVAESKLTVNKLSRPFVFWTTGDRETFAWDRARVDLKNGKNAISLTLPEDADIEVKRINIVKVK